MGMAEHWIIGDSNFSTCLNYWEPACLPACLPAFSSMTVEHHKVVGDLPKSRLTRAERTCGCRVEEGTKGGRVCGGGGGGEGRG